MRRLAAPVDSLELLLDTICNTFGGVLFIAILVVLLLQTVPDQAQSSGAQPSPSISRAVEESQTQEISTLQRKIERQRENQQATDELVDRLASAELKTLLEEKKTVEAEEARLKTAIEDLSDKTVKTDQQASEIKRDTQELAHQKQSLEQTKTDLERQFDDIRSKRTFDVRLPKARTAPLKNEIGIVLRFGRMYLWHRYDGNMNRAGLNTDDFLIVSETGNQIVVRPDPSKGIPLDGSDEMKAKIKLLMKGFSQNDSYISFIVRSDSFTEFRHVRDMVKELGFEYRLMPGDGPVHDRGGSADIVQ